VCAIQLADCLEHHRKTIPSAWDPLKASAEIKVVPDPKLKLQMVVKLIDLHIQPMRDLVVSGSRQVTNVQSEVCQRHFATTSRDLRQAVDWYLYLRDMSCEESRIS